MRPAFRVAVAAAVAAIALTISGCGGSTAAPSSSPAQTPAASSTTVVIKNFAFHAQALTVRVGTTVSWQNEDPSPTVHTATADEGAFDTGAIRPGSTMSFRFTTTGDFLYHCSVHTYMTGSVKVVP